MKKSKKSKGKRLKIRNGKEVVIVYKTRVPVEETLFPEKQKRAEEIVSKTRFLDK
jgi:hypothetical protein